MRKLLIFGARAYAELAHYYFSKQSDYQVVAFTVDGKYVEESTYCGLPVLPFEEVVNEFPPKTHDVFVAIGHQNLNAQRQEKVRAVDAKHYRLASFISPKASVAEDISVGPNSMVMEYVSLQPFVRIGKNSVIWTATRMGFHSHIGDHCWIVSAIFGERVRIGDNSFVGLNATIAPRVQIGKANVIGAGALILRDSQDNQVFRGPVSKPSKVPSSRLPNF